MSFHEPAPSHPSQHPASPNPHFNNNIVRGLRYAYYMLGRQKPQCLCQCRLDVNWFSNQVMRLNVGHRELIENAITRPAAGGRDVDWVTAHLREHSVALDGCYAIAGHRLATSQRRRRLSIVLRCTQELLMFLQMARPVGWTVFGN